MRLKDPRVKTAGEVSGCVRRWLPESVVFETKVMMELQVLVMTKVRCDQGSKKPN